MAYTAGDHLIRTVMTTQSGLVADQVINDFAFKFDGTPVEADFLNVIGAVGDDFFRNGAAAVNKVGNYIGTNVNRAVTHKIEVYKIVAGPMGSPVYEADWLGPPTPTVSDSCPDEVAGVLSFHADLTGISEESGATRPKARRRGRLFIGPLSLQAIDYDVEPVPLSSNFTTALRARAIAMHDAAEADDWTWCVWSRADQVLRPVVAGWTDNAPDTQRRRGFKATARIVYTV